MADCKWMQDEICVNAECPMCADYCPVPDIEGVCRFEDRADCIEKPYDRSGDDAESDAIDDPEWEKRMMQKFVWRRSV